MSARQIALVPAIDLAQGFMLNFGRQLLFFVYKIIYETLIRSDKK